MSKKSRQKSIKRLLIFGVSSFAVIGVLTWTIGKYWVQIFQKYKEKEFLDTELIELKKKEEELKVDVEKLQDPDYVARYAREKYLYSKEGEFIIRIP